MQRYNRRELIGGLAGVAVAGPTGGAAAAHDLTAEVTRVAPDRIRLTWSPAHPVEVRVSDRPDEDAKPGKLLRVGAGRSEAEFSLPRLPRPYLQLRTGDDVVRVAERVLPLQGIRNMRDLGGYRSEDGRQVRWGRIYRSSQMDRLTPQDRAYLSALHVGVVCDLRSRQERKAAPNPLAEKPGGLVLRALDYDYDALPSSTGGMATKGQTIAAFADSYARYAPFLADQFADLFDQLEAGAAPVVFNCTAGKDRTGMAAALVLTVLGVPRAAVVADYALTQAYWPPSAMLRDLAAPTHASGTVVAEEARRIAELPPYIIDVFYGSDPEVMRQALSLVDERHGGLLALAKSRMRLSDARIERLRRTYLV